MRALDRSRPCFAVAQADSCDKKDGARAELSRAAISNWARGGWSPARRRAVAAFVRNLRRGRAGARRRPARSRSRPSRATYPWMPRKCGSGRCCSTTSVSRAARCWPAPPATCWPRAGMTAGRAPPGLDGELLNFNAPTVFNAALSFRLNWRGNFRTLEEQNEAVLLDPPSDEHDLGGAASRSCGADRGLPGGLRQRSMAERPAPAQVLDALATFQRSLITPDAPLRPLPARRARCHHAGGRARLPAVQGLRLRRLPSGRQRRRQSVPALRHLPRPVRRRAASARPTSAASPSPARRMTASSSAFRACATSP